jgi:geranylgeranyl diphosphate synthase type I
MEVIEASQAVGVTYGPEVGLMVGAVRNLCARGGKRLRPALCLVGALCKDEDFDWTPALAAGVSLELLQAYFLIHDDWMDQDSERRGGPTAHVELGRHFRSKALGERSAILAGDHAVALASSHLAQLAVPPSRLRGVMLRFAEMQLAAVAGQQLDICAKTPNPELTYELKTASYTVRGPLLLGAELAGASRATRDALAAFSLPAGVAFQLRDDLIGVFGAPNETGKPRGGDLKEGKNTSLVQFGRELLGARELALLERVLGNPRATPLQLERVIGFLETCGARAAVENRIEELKTVALASTTHKSITPLGRRLLNGAVSALSDRKT